jgi:molybdate/tungstate transport system permease protein
LVVAQPTGVVFARLTDSSVIDAARLSVETATVTTALATVFGVPLAYWLARSDWWGKPAVLALVALPLVLPPIVTGMLILTIVGPNTLLGTIASSAGISLTSSFVGVVLAQLFVASPFVVITATAAFEGVDIELEYASRSLGKSRLTTIRRVTLPIARTGIIAGMTLTFARAIGEFGATIMLSYNPRTMPVEIWVAFTTLGLESAFPVAIVLLGVAVGVIVLLNTIGSTPWR